ncbi:thioredoxin family protein [Mucilaginibacter psychrotolerans]|uniref:Thioredoxin family protein n=1 Tax=Mucilaginibacter psychrotolerans TaxID=1524096 RepID=A0A4Y8S987_9SPHI|nr:thioredoxin family protein [Mucilaginibacter psychrotolerans]
MNYTKLNWFRQQRWFKNGILNDELVNLIKGINTIQKWILITEPWCGDAPHVLPFILKLAAFNANIEIDIQLRDAFPFTIENYLSGNSKAIPKLVVRNNLNKDLFVWGPRPRECQKLYEQLKSAKYTHEQIHSALQNWYNQDKGVSLQMEILELSNPVSNPDYAQV